MTSLAECLVDKLLMEDLIYTFKTYLEAGSTIRLRMADYLKSANSAMLLAA